MQVVYIIHTTDNNTDCVADAWENKVELRAPLVAWLCGHFDVVFIVVVVLHVLAFVIAVGRRRCILLFLLAYRHALATVAFSCCCCIVVIVVVVVGFVYGQTGLFIVAAAATASTALVARRHVIHDRWRRVVGALFVMINVRSWRHFACIFLFCSHSLELSLFISTIR